MGTHRNRLSRLARTTRQEPTAPAPDATAPVAAPAQRTTTGLPVLLRTGALVVVAVLTIVVATHGQAVTSGPAAQAVPADSPTAGASGGSPSGGGGTSGGSAAPSPTATSTTSPLPPAPAGFAASVDDLYATMHTTATAGAVPGTPDVPATAQFNADVAQLTPSDLAIFYQVTQHTDNWDTLGKTFSDTTAQIGPAVAAAGGPAAVAKATAKARASHAATARAKTGTTSGSGKSSRALPSVPQTSPSALQDYEPDTAPAPFVAGSCPQGAPGTNEGEDALFATQIAIDALDEAGGDAPQEIVSAFGNVTIPDPVKIVLDALKFVATIIHDTFDYLQSVAGDCSGDNMGAELDNIDNTTYDTYTLLSQVGQTVNEVDSNVAKLLSETEATARQQLIQDIEAALSAPAGSIPVVADEIPASQGGFLDSQPVGVQAIVTDALETMNTTGQPVNPLASRTLVRADQALGAGQFKQAYVLFKQTYGYIAD